SHLQDRYAAGAPELIAETSQSSASIDLMDKKKLYRQAGVREYLVLVIPQQELHWYRLTGSSYKRATVPADGILRSQVFPGLWLDIKALITGDMARVLAVLQEGLNSSEHADFVQRLVERRPESKN